MSKLIILDFFKKPSLKDELLGKARYQINEEVQKYFKENKVIHWQRSSRGYRIVLEIKDE
jgi:hypothetical protein